MSRFGSLEFGETPPDNPPHAGPAKDARFYLGAAAAQFEGGFLREALRQYAKVLEFEPGNVEAWVGQLRMLTELGEEREAATWAAQAVERFPASAEILACRAATLVRLGDTAAALAYSDAAVDRSHQAPLVWLARGEVLLARGGLKSEHSFERAAAFAPELWSVRWHAARIHSRHAHHAKALKFAREGLSIDPAMAPLWLEKGRAELALGLGAEGRRSLAHALELSPRMPGPEELLSNAARDGFLGGMACRIKAFFQKA